MAGIYVGTWAFFWIRGQDVYRMRKDIVVQKHLPYMQGIDDNEYGTKYDMG
jgi:hypothetical protein